MRLEERKQNDLHQGRITISKETDHVCVNPLIGIRSKHVQANATPSKQVHSKSGECFSPIVLLTNKLKK